MGSNFDRILDLISPFIIFILILIRFRFFIQTPTSIEGLDTHILLKYYIPTYEMNYFFKKIMNIKNNLSYNSNKNYYNVIS